MNLSELPQIVRRSKKRVGRGMGSGKGSHTSGRGMKGQKARGDVKLIFEGTKMKKSLLKRLPFQRGKNKMKPLSLNPVTLDVSFLEKFTGTEVTVEALVKQKIVGGEATYRGVKILGNAAVKRALTVNVPVSKAAEAKITASGGKINSNG